MYEERSVSIMRNRPILGARARNSFLSSTSQERTLVSALDRILKVVGLFHLEPVYCGLAQLGRAVRWVSLML